MAMFNNQRVLYRYLIPVRHPTSPGCRVFVKVTSAPWTFRSYPPSQTVMTSLYGQHHQLPGIRRWSASYCGWLQNPAPVDRWFIPLFIGFQPSKVVQDFFHPQYQQKDSYSLPVNRCVTVSPTITHKMGLPSLQNAQLTNIAAKWPFLELCRWTYGYVGK